MLWPFWGFYLNRFCLPLEGTLRAMLPKQQTKDARYKPIDTEKPYTKKHLKAGAQIIFTIFLAFSWTDFAYFVRGRSEPCEWNSKRKMPDKSRKTVRCYTNGQRLKNLAGCSRTCLRNVPFPEPAVKRKALRTFPLTPCNRIQGANLSTTWHISSKNKPCRTHDNHAQHSTLAVVKADARQVDVSF